MENRLQLRIIILQNTGFEQSIQKCPRFVYKKSHFATVKIDILKQCFYNYSITLKSKFGI